MQVNHSMDWTVRYPFRVGRGWVWADGSEPSVGWGGLRYRSRRAGGVVWGGGWLPDMDSNHDKQIQSLLCYRYTIRQTPNGRSG